MFTCSFCGKPQSEVDIVAGPCVYICRECVDVCNEALKKNETGRIIESEPTIQQTANHAHIVDLKWNSGVIMDARHSGKMYK